MKVLHVIPSLSPFLGGPTTVVINLVKALLNNGVEAEIVTTNHNGCQPLDVPLYKKIEYEQVPVWFLPYFSPPMKEFIFSPALTKWLWQNIKDYDILDNHYLFSYAPSCAAAIARWHNIPYTIRTQGQLTPWALTQSKRKKQIYSMLVERHNLNHAAAIHCTSDAEAQNVRKYGIKTPIIKLPLGVEQVDINPQAVGQLHSVYSIYPQTPIILFLSRLCHNKYPDMLIKALSLINADSLDFHLLMAGTGEPDYVNYLKQLVISLNLTNRVTFTGFVQNEQKNLLLQSADLFVLPSVSENFSIATAEAMAAGIPVVVTPGVQLASEIITANAGYIVEQNVNALHIAISDLLTSPKLRQQLGENGSIWASNRYCPNQIASNLARAYSAIINKTEICESQIPQVKEYESINNYYKTAMPRY
ncbi:MAG: glycosyltransferase [Richelia sp. RM2_1_2]|nr:glycosyltransferase [Richelia sp. RM1_1_1]NJO59192.1 glycosyltransferase [Richelia sp. RM2_1_2]